MGFVFKKEKNLDFKTKASSSSRTYEVHIIMKPGF